MTQTPGDRAHRPRRSVLYLPASNARALVKATSIPCDALVFDLEDAVAPDAKEAAREAACDAVRSGRYGRRELTVRVNGKGTAWHADDLARVCEAGPDAVVVPKVESAEEVCDVVAAMEAAGAPATTSLWAMIETPTAVLRCAEIADAHDRLTVLVLGTNDLALELGAEHVPGREPLLPALGMALLGARAARRTVLDGVYNGVRDPDGFVAECDQGRRMGFAGKTLVHPDQVAGANAAFAPGEEAVRDAEGIVAAWERGGGAGVLTHRGRMIEHLHVVAARRVLDVASAVAASDEPDEPRGPVRSP